MQEENQQPPIEIGPNGMSIDLLRAVYRDASLALAVRMRAAIAALPHEVPRLQVSAQITENDFAVLLDERIKRHQSRLNGNGPNRMKLIPPTEVKPSKLVRRI
jgi:hypothetical protein